MNALCYVLVIRVRFAMLLFVGLFVDHLFCGFIKAHNVNKFFDYYTMFIILSNLPFHINTNHHTSRHLSRMYVQLFGNRAQPVSVQRWLSVPACQRTVSMSSKRYRTHLWPLCAHSLEPSQRSRLSTLRLWAQQRLHVCLQWGTY